MIKDYSVVDICDKGVLSGRDIYKESNKLYNVSAEVPLTYFSECGRSETETDDAGDADQTELRPEYCTLSHTEQTTESPST